MSKYRARRRSIDYKITAQQRVAILDWWKTSARRKSMVESHSAGVDLLAGNLPEIMFEWVEHHSKKPARTQAKK